MEQIFEQVAQSGQISYEQLLIIREISISHVFQLAQPYFVNSNILIKILIVDNEVRKKISSVIFQLFLKSQIQKSKEIEAISLFFINKFTDIACSLEAVKIVNLLITIQLDNLSDVIFDSFIAKISSDIFYVPSYNQETKINIYKILSSFTKKKPEKIINEEFVKLVLRVTENEKDPRNILVVFELYSFILNEFPSELVKPYKSDIFNYLEAYYPIDFSPKIKKQIKITREDIQRVLDKCFTSNILLDLSFELIYENLNSQSEVAEISALRTIQMIFMNQSSLPLRELQRIWEKIQLLIEENLDDHLAEEIIETIQSIILFLNNKNKDYLIEISNIPLLLRIKNYFLLKVFEKPQSQQAKLGLDCLKAMIESNRNMNQLISTDILLLFVKSTHQNPLHKIEIFLQIIFSSKTQFQNEFPNKKIKFYIPQTLLDEFFTAINCFYEDYQLFAFILKSLLELYNDDILQEKVCNLGECFYEQFNQYSLLQQKCLFDFFQQVKLSHKMLELLNKDAQKWQVSNPELFEYAIEGLCNLFPDLLKQLSGEILTKFAAGDQVTTLKLVRSFQRHELIAKNFFRNCVEIIIQNNVIENNYIKEILNSIEEQFGALHQFSFLDLVKNDKLCFYIQNTEHLNDQALVFLDQIVFCETQNTGLAKKHIYKTLKFIIRKNLQHFEKYQNSFKFINNYSTEGLNQIKLKSIIIQIGLTQGVQSSYDQLAQQLQNPLIVQGVFVENDLDRIATYSQRMMDYFLIPLMEKQENQLSLIFLKQINLEVLKVYTKYQSQIVSIILQNIEIIESDASILDILLQLNDHNLMDQLLQKLVTFLEKSSKIQINQLRNILIFIGDKTAQMAQMNNLKNVRKFVNHRKRIVRQAAQYAINKWYVNCNKGL